MHAISSYRGNRPTNKQTDSGDYNTLRHSLARSVTMHVLLTQHITVRFRNKNYTWEAEIERADGRQESREVLVQLRGERVHKLLQHCGHLLVWSVVHRLDAVAFQLLQQVYNARSDSLSSTETSKLTFPGSKLTFLHKSFPP